MESPNLEQLAFLPHPRSAPSPKSSSPQLSTSAPSTSYFPQRPLARSNSGSHSRSRSGPHPRSNPTRTNSAPSSPAGRVLPAGLAPLSTISPIVNTLSLPAPLATINGHVSGGGTGSGGPAAGPQQDQRHASQPLRASASPRGETNSKVSVSPQAARYTSALPPLLNPAASIRVGSRIHRGPLDSRSIASSDTETEGFDSDTTFVPYRGARPSKSLSQPDLTALRTWVGGVAQGQAEERRAKEAKRQTPPSQPVPLASRPSIASTSRSKSHTQITTLRKSPSARFQNLVQPLTPALSTSSDGSSPRIYDRSPEGFHGVSLGGVTGSEDADDDYDGTDSPSSGSLTFSPKHRLRQRKVAERAKGSLGLSFGPETPPANVRKAELLPELIERRLQESSLLPLRLLAIVPSIWGIVVLALAFISGETWVEVWPWGVDLSREALERLLAGGELTEGSKRNVSRGDMLLAMAWAVCTAHFCFCLTTGLTVRWRSYYSLPSTLTRLLSLQCLCWPATYITLWFLGAHRPLLAWVVIGVTTGWSRTVQMWVTSNVEYSETTPKAKSPPMPLEDLGWWETFNWERRWDWDEIARQVGWKVGGLLLITSAWLFYGLETGRLVEVV